KDTVIAYPGQVTRVKALFDLPGLFVWHCHILEHEDNEMMRPYRVVHHVFMPDVWKNATTPAE
ncbi:MAG TPA: multicopper oxidase domain-containing protein, partial [Anaerolineae bacterium]|nr:multicopper oxidase domain-containing protein [Anaerolineae bacterium]